MASALIAIIVTRRGLRPVRIEMTDHSPNRARPIEATYRFRPGGRASCNRSPSRSTKCLNASTIRLPGCRSFPRDLAHELRTPIANMLGEAQVALTRDRTAVDYRETIEIHRCRMRTAFPDRGQFAFCRAWCRTHRTGLVRKRFDARAAVEKIAEFYQTVADDHHVTITCSGDGQIYADPDLFERAVGNLLDNALRFTATHGSIRVAVSKHNGDFEVTVSDNGSGIGAEHLPRVFDRFYRAESSRSSDGAGLGLALVKSIVELHGGSAVIESNVGRGTTVKMIFPSV